MSSRPTTEQLSHMIKNAFGEHDKIMNDRFDRIEQKIVEEVEEVSIMTRDSFEKLNDILEIQFNKIDVRFNGVDKRLDLVEQRVEFIDNRTKKLINVLESNKVISPYQATEIISHSV